MPDGNDGKHIKIWTPATYHIEVEGEMSMARYDNFSDMRITTRKRRDKSIVTILSGRVRDQAELSGLMNNLTECHLPILSVNLIDDDNGNR